MDLQFVDGAFSFDIFLGIPIRMGNKQVLFGLNRLFAFPDILKPVIPVT